MTRPLHSRPPRVPRAPGVTLLVLFAPLALLLGGCGYQQSGDFNREPQGIRPVAADNPNASPPRWDGAPAGGYQWRQLYREDLQTVAVPIFQNRDFRRGLEFKLTKALVNSIESHTPYKVVSAERADTILEGEIISAQADNLSKTFRNNVPQEQLMTVTVNFTWKDLRTGQILLERKDFRQTASWYPTLGEGEFVGQQAALELLAVSIVHELEADW